MPSPDFVSRGPAYTTEIGILLEQQLSRPRAPLVREYEVGRRARNPTIHFSWGLSVRLHEYNVASRDSLMTTMQTVSWRERKTQFRLLVATPSAREGMLEPTSPEMRIDTELQKVDREGVWKVVAAIVSGLFIIAAAWIALKK